MPRDAVVQMLPAARSLPAVGFRHSAATAPQDPPASNDYDEPLYPMPTKQAPHQSNVTTQAFCLASG